MDLEITMKFKTFATFALFIFFIIPSQAQENWNHLDPANQLYSLFNQWQIQGLIHNLPVIRPYPKKVIVQILKTVLTNGSSQDKLLAKPILEQFTRDSAFSLEAKPQGRLQAPQGLFAIESIASLRLLQSFSPEIDMSFQISLLGLDYTQGGLDVLGEGPRVDYFSDAAGFSFAGRQIMTRVTAHSDLTWGSENFFFKAGFHRSSYGYQPTNGIILGAQSPFMPQVQFTTYNDALNYTFLLALLSATNSLDKTSRYYPQKYMALHDLRYTPTSQLEFSFFESSIFGGRFEPSYLIPTSTYFFNQAYAGFADNVQMGLSGSVLLGNNLRFSSTILADDLSFNDLLKLKLTKFKVAAQATLDWAPQSSALRLLSLDYTLVTPFTYSHVFNDNGGEDPRKADSPGGNPTGALEPNYLNYTHMGYNLGPALEPNSDRITLKAELSPFDQFSLGFSGRLIRHANASEGRALPSVNDDGTIFDDGYNDEIKDGGFLFWDHTPFLTQSNIQTTLQGILNIDYQLPLNTAMRLIFSSDYTWEHAFHKSESKHILGLSISYLWDF